MNDAAATPATDEFDEWAGESGFKDNFDGLITDAFFTKDQKYNNGETLILDMKILADDGEEVEQIYPCGAEWDSYDNGETAEHPKDTEGRPKSFNHNSAVFGLMQHAFEAGAEDELRKRGRPRKAAIWKGLKFHWMVESKKMTIRDRQTGEPREITTTRTYPDKFLGVFDVDGSTAQSGAASTPGSSSPAPPAATTPTPPASSPPASSSNGAFDLSGHDAAMIAKLKIHAKSKPYSEFLDAALAVDGVTTNDDLLALLGEESFYQQLKA